jgi:hypothetical protein
MAQIEQIREEDIIKSIKKYLDEDDKKYFDAAIKQCVKEELKRKIVSHSHYIYSSILCDGIENVIKYLTNLKELGYTEINTCYDDFEAYKYEEEDDEEYQIRIENLIRDEIGRIKEKEEQYRKDQEEIKRLEKRIKELKSKKHGTTN